MVGKHYIVRSPAPWINIIVRGAFKFGPIQILLQGAHLNWLAKIKLKEPEAPWINIIVGDPFKLGAI